MNNSKIAYSIKRRKKEFLSFSVAFITALISFGYRNDPGIVFSGTILVTLISSLLTLYFILKEKEFYFIAFDSYKDKEDWFGSGTFDYNKSNNSFLVADTEAGFIFSKCLLWNNYFVSTEFKILNDCLGVIIRATNSSNYVMLQIRKDKIRPHIRANGGWIPYEVEATGLAFEESIKDGRWYKLELTVKGEMIEIKIFDSKKTIINKAWLIAKGKASIPVFDKNDNERKTHTHITDISVSFDYGSIGFRQSNREKAFVKNLLIKSLN